MVWWVVGWLLGWLIDVAGILLLLHTDTKGTRVFQQFHRVDGAFPNCSSLPNHRIIIIISLSISLAVVL